MGDDMKTSKSIADVVRVGVCVDRDRVPCKEAQDYLAKKGLICNNAPKKNTRKKRKKGFWETVLSWFV